MSALVTLEDDTGAGITSYNWGAVADGSALQYKFKAANTGDQNATSVIVSAERLNQNDGFDFALLALDVSGNPGAFSASSLNIGTLTPGQVVSFWVKVNIPVGTTPGGNPRQFNTLVTYAGT